MGKGKNACYEQFLFSSQCFQKLCVFVAVKWVENEVGNSKGRNIANHCFQETLCHKNMIKNKLFKKPLMIASVYNQGIYWLTILDPLPHKPRV